MKEFQVSPDPEDPRLTERVCGYDHNGDEVELDTLSFQPVIQLNGWIRHVEIMDSAPAFASVTKRRQNDEG